MNVASAPRTGFQVELQIAVSFCRFDNVLKCRYANRSASEIGVEYYSRCIDDAPQRKTRIGIEFVSDRKIEGPHAVDETVTGQSSHGNFFPYANEDGPRGFCNRAVRANLEHGRELRSQQKIVDRRQQSVKIGLFVALARLFNTLHRATALKGNVLRRFELPQQNRRLTCTRSVGAKHTSDPGCTQTGAPKRTKKRIGGIGCN